MKAVLQRVTEASVRVDGEVIGSIGKGFFILLGVSDEDDEAVADKMADKICKLRIFEDEPYPCIYSILYLCITGSMYFCNTGLRSGKQPAGAPFLHLVLSSIPESHSIPPFFPEIRQQRPHSLLRRNSSVCS